MQVTRSNACIQEAFEKLCTTKMETFSSVHLDRAVTENTGKFSVLLNNIKQFDKIVKILKEGGEVTFTV